MNTPPDDVLHIAEIPYESGAIRFRYARRLAPDGSKWVRDGLFVEYYENGVVASEGEYENDLEVGIWRDYYENGQLAAEGNYLSGKEHGTWSFWDEQGMPEPQVVFVDGEPQAV